MSKVPEKESKILKASRYIEKGQLSQGKIAAAVHISKNHVSIIARKWLRTDGHPRMLNL